jgi:hypothetical protein
MSVSDEPSNAASESLRNIYVSLSEAASAPSEKWVRAGLTDDFVYEDRRSGPSFPDADAESMPKIVLSMWQTGAGNPRWSTDTLVVRGERFAAVAMQVDYGNGMTRDYIMVFGLDAALRQVQRQIIFDRDDVDGAMAELDQLHIQSEAG